MEIKHKRYIYLTENVSYMLNYLIKKSPRIIKFFNIDDKQKMYAASNHFKIKVALHPLWRKKMRDGVRILFIYADIPLNSINSLSGLSCDFCLRNVTGFNTSACCSLMKDYL